MSKAVAQRKRESFIGCTFPARVGIVHEIDESTREAQRRESPRIERIDDAMKAEGRRSAVHEIH
jgi:hypothetical protein